MPEIQYLHEYREGDRIAQVLKNTTSQQFTVYCFCCGHEAESEAFDSEQDAESWAEDWVQKQVELAELEEQAGPDGCRCQD